VKALLLRVAIVPASPLQGIEVLDS